MRLVRLPGPFAREAGLCYAIELPSVPAVLADDEINPRRSAAVLFEEDAALRFPHALHGHIRSMGEGRYSHWKNTLFFSASDNSDPNTNGRRYTLLVAANEPGGIGPSAAAVGLNDATFLDALRANVEWSGGALYAAMHVYRLYRELLRKVQSDVTGKTILEIGAGHKPGVALAFLLVGAHRYLANDIKAVSPELSRSYAQTLLAVLNSTGTPLVRDLDEVCEFEPSGAGRLKASCYTALTDVAAERIALPNGSIDLVLSASVLEHVVSPQAVISRSFELLRPGGFGIHAIDLRDHSNYFDPLGFLRLTEEAYAPKATENRWRASDFLKAFLQAGFEVVGQHYRDENMKLNPDGTVDLFAVLGTPFRSLAPLERIEQARARVSAAERSAYIPRFRSKSREDLSVQMMWIAVRKPAAERGP